jgi:hypothetical protein
MKGILVAAALFAVSSLPALAQSSSDMDCSHFRAMNAAGQMAAVDSMHSSMSDANKMNSSGNMSAGAMSSGDHMSTHDMTKKVATACKTHPDMMVRDAMKNAMAH